jgi:hypothetical protein
MATRVWLGTINGSWDEPRNWTGEAIPATGDTVVIPTGATQNINAGLAQSAVDVAKFSIEPGCSINIGSGGNPLQLGTAASAAIHLDGTGTIHLEVAGGLSGGDIHILGSGTYYLASYSTEEMTDDLFIMGAGATVYVSPGSGDKALVDDIYVYANATVYLGKETDDTSDTLRTSLHTTAGTIRVRCGLLHCNIRGGTVTWEGELAQSSSGVVTVYAGTLNFNSTEAAVVPIGDLYIHNAGTFDMSGSQTLATAITNVYIYGAGVFNDPNSANPIGTIFHLVGTSLDAATVNFGQNRRITVT